MPGEKEAPQDEILVFDMNNRDKVIKPDIKAFKDQDVSILNYRRLASERDDDYVPTRWLSKYNDRLYFQRTSRDLKRIDVCYVDIKTGEVKTVIEERLNTYIDFNGIALINNEKEIIHWSERDGWGIFTCTITRKSHKADNQWTIPLRAPCWLQRNHQNAVLHRKWT